jgi:hypothetical protein
MTMSMNEIFNAESLGESANDDGFQEELESLDYPSTQLKSQERNVTCMRQIEILRENKLLMSSLKDIYDY